MMFMFHCLHLSVYEEEGVTKLVFSNIYFLTVYFAFHCQMATCTQWEVMTAPRILQQWKNMTPR